MKRIITAVDIQRRPSGFGHIGIRAIAHIEVGGIRQKVMSAGLCGIEDDSSESYLNEVEDKEKAQLRIMLYELGFSKRAVAQAF